MKRFILLLVITTMVANIAAGARVSVLKGLRNVPRYKNVVRPIVIGGFASRACYSFDNSYQNNATLSPTYYDTMAVTPAVQTDSRSTICTNGDSLHSITKVAASAHDNAAVGTTNTTESGFSVWLYVLFGMMVLAIIVFIYMLFVDGAEEAPVVNRQAFVATKPSPRTIELANNGGIMIF